MSYFRSNTLIAAKVLAAKDWSHPTCIQAARHMARDGASVQEIADALGWTVCWETAYRRLRKFNIRPIGNTRAHRGVETTCPRTKNGIDARSYWSGGR